MAKLNINLAPGEYILTAINPVNGEMVSSLVKVLPILEGKDLVMFYLDGNKYECKLVDGSGNPVSGANILFNIHGVFYNKLTDSQGIARLNINLLVGSYIITAYYNDTATSNTIEVKPWGY